MIPSICGDGGDTDNGKCELLGPFALLVQGILGILAISSLVWKRYHEHPHRRPWTIWIFDVSKQVLGALLIHILNIFLSILRLKIGLNLLIIEKNNKLIYDNPCDYYFLNILFDTTIGIPILYFFIKLITIFCSLCKINGIKSGEYGNPPNLKNYIKQLLIYFLSLSLMKISIYTIMIFFPILIKLSFWLLSRLDNYPNIQISFVLLIFPLIMNIFQYYVIDNLIQSKKYYATNKIVQNLRLEDSIYRDNEIDEELPEEYLSILSTDV
ncbi:hypothetical protein C6P40_003995 [Pichia californica]|uniref:Vacuolar membrane protein n=1 Tax=Pichia californica TaxID=460514 RepID=A0A9P6WIM9_9ASCO|nr:hypothetical protein C6P42_003762 [[Candida] californica]KAG0686468.1 hypothetical protein C6P40_003995 [[Candida] californica]